MKWKLLQQLFFMSKLLFYSLVIQMFFTGLLLASDGLAQDKVSIEDVYLSLKLIVVQLGYFYMKTLALGK